ncbi:uncharacterized protein LOC116135902 [Pistacia vera]|uniref:uncharacterized protein LOC116135902 n=1 Tax=Pistacia vera TaxID=55513 RepID=UPI001263D159|nr:uncharacterized protein LOC116135902 [Pistacia vera]
MEKFLSKLLNMLKTTKKDMKKSNLMMLVDLAPWKGKGKRGKGKAKSKSKPQTQDAFKPTRGMSKDGMVVCFHCGKPGHWNKHCKAFLVIKNKKPTSSSKGMYTIEISISPVTSWVIDTVYGSHICTNVQGCDKVDY